MKIVVIDGQGGKIGGLLIEKLITLSVKCNIIAIGTNTMATSTMLKAGANQGATGENAVIVNCRDADYIIGPIGIIAADSLLGELTPNMAVAIGSSPAKKVLVPMNLNNCNFYVVGMKDLSLNELINSTYEYIKTQLTSGL